jgi:hypothetical protein
MWALQNTVAQYRSIDKFTKEAEMNQMGDKTIDVGNICRYHAIEIVNRQMVYNSHVHNSLMHPPLVEPLPPVDGTWDPPVFSIDDFVGTCDFSDEEMEQL